MVPGVTQGDGLWCCGMDNTQIAWTRTTFTSLWLGVVLFVSAKLGWEFDAESPLAIIGIGLTGGVVWRASELLARVPYLGYILFGVDKEPVYVAPADPGR